MERFFVTHSRALRPFCRTPPRRAGKFKPPALRLVVDSELNQMKSSNWLRCYWAIHLLVILYPLSALASASQARISHLTIKTTADSLLVNLKIDSDFAPEMKAAVLNGVPIRFTISIDLYEVNDLWFDKTVAAKTAVHELRYDAIRKVFKIVHSRSGPQPATVDDFDTARLLISEVIDLAVIALTDLKKGEHYQLMVGTMLSLKRYPLFNLYQEVITDRYSVNFIY